MVGLSTSGLKNTGRGNTLFIRLNIVGLDVFQWSEMVADVYWARFSVAVNITCIPVVVIVFTAH